MAEQITPVAKTILPAIVKVVQELPAEQQGFILGYAKCISDDLHKETANE